MTFQRKTLLNVLILTVLTLGITYLLRFDIYEHDDFFQSFAYTNNLWDIIKSADHGRYFSWLYMKLIVHGSSALFHIHPNDNLFIKLIVGINISLITLAMALFLSKPFKNKLSPICLLATVFAMLFLYTKSLPQIHRYNQHFAYQTNFFFYLFIWGIIARYFIQGEPPQKKDLALNSFLAFFLGITAHFNILSTIASCGFLFLYAFIRFYMEDKSIKHILSKFFYLGRGVYIPLASFFVGIVLYFSAPSFQELLASRTNTNEGNRVIVALTQLPDFLPEWFSVVFIQHQAWLLMSMFIIACCYIIYLIHKKSINDINQAIRVIVLGCAIILGVAFFNGTLLINGRSMYSTNKYWIHHSDLILITRMIQLVALWLVIGYISSLPLKERFGSKILSFKTKIKPCYFILIVFIILFGRNIPQYVHLYDSLKAERSNWYQTEKIYRLYSLLGKEAILPANRDNANGSYHHNQLNTSTPENPMGWTGLAYVKRNYRLIYHNNIPFTSNSLRNDYSNTNHYVDYILTNSNIAIQLFTELGGSISPEEIDYPIFNNLFDEKFILGQTND